MTAMVLMLLAGAANTISKELTAVIKFQDNTVVQTDREVLPFHHPIFQTSFVFLTELCIFACLLPYLYFSGHRNPHSWRQVSLIFPCVLLDLVHSTLSFMALYHTSASVYQMLRASNVVFSALFTLALLRNKLLAH